MSACVYVQPTDPAVDCPVAVYERHDGPSSGPRVHAYRDGKPVDIAFSITKSENVILDVEEQQLDCASTVIDTQLVSLPYRRYELSFYGLEVGDQLYVDDQRLAPVTSGGCNAGQTFTPTCQLPPVNACPGGAVPPPSTPPGDSDSDPTTDENLSPYGNGMNCSAGGSGSLLVAFAILIVTSVSGTKRARRSRRG